MASGAICKHIFLVPADHFMEDLLLPRPESNICGYVSTPAPAVTVLMDPACLHIREPRRVQGIDQPRNPVGSFNVDSSFDCSVFSKSKTIMNSNGRRPYLKWPNADQLDVLTLVMSPETVKELELHDSEGAATALARYIFDIIESYRDLLLRKRIGSSCVDASTLLKRLHDALQPGGDVKPEERYWKVMRAVEDITRGGDPFGSLLEDLRRLAGQRGQALAKVEALKRACETDIPSESLRKKVTAVAFWLTLAAILGIVFGNLVSLTVLGAVGVAKGAIDMWELYQKAKEEAAKEKKNQLDDVALSVSALGKVEKKLEQAVAEYRSFMDFVEKFEVRIRLLKVLVIEQREIEEATRKAAEAQRAVEKVEMLGIEMKTAVDEVRVAVTSLDETKFTKHCCGPCCIIM